jgi:hypothetical protein
VTAATCKQGFFQPFDTQGVISDIKTALPLHREQLRWRVKNQLGTSRDLDFALVFAGSIAL